MCQGNVLIYVGKGIIIEMYAGWPKSYLILDISQIKGHKKDNFVILSSAKA